MKINKKGFTLIELLGVIAVVSLVLGLSIYGIGKIIENSKAKSEEISITGIERAASTYSGESDYKGWQLKDKKEYFCITVGELVNKGMLKKDSVSGKTNYDLSSYVAVVKDYDTRVLEKSKLILNDDTSSTEYQVCTGTEVGDGETATLPNISGGSTYTDEIVDITFTDGSTNLSDKVIEGSRKCFYGTTTSNINNNDNVIVDEVNKTCNISKLKQSTDYYVKVCMSLASGAYVCSNSEEYITETVKKPNIEFVENKSVTVTYDTSNIKGDNYKYYYSPIGGTSNVSTMLCSKDGNKMVCSGSSTTNIAKNTWYIINSNSVKITFSDEAIGDFDTIFYDKTGNYATNTKKVWKDTVKPTCTIDKSNIGSTDGVTIKVSCSDDTAGCKEITKTYENIKETTKYEVEDKVGNIGECTATVTEETQYRKKTCSTCSRCSAAGCSSYADTYDCEPCTTSGGGCKRYGYYAAGSYGSYSRCSSNCSGSCEADDDLSGTGVTGGWVCYKYGCTGGYYPTTTSCATCGGGCESYYRSCPSCGCSSWGNFGDWSTTNSCSSTDKNNNSCSDESRKVYK